MSGESSILNFRDPQGGEKSGREDLARTTCQQTFPRLFSVLELAS